MHGLPSIISEHLDEHTLGLSGNPVHTYIVFKVTIVRLLLNQFKAM